MELPLPLVGGARKPLGLIWDLSASAANHGLLLCHPPLGCGPVLYALQAMGNTQCVVCPSPATDQSTIDTGGGGGRE